MAQPQLDDFESPSRFDVARHLGSGGMGAVFEAFDRERNERVAVKTLRTRSADALLHLKNEFRSLQDVRHDNLVNFRDLLEIDGRFFMTMELVEGCDLLSYVRPGAVDTSISGETETQLLRSQRERIADEPVEVGAPNSAVRGRFDEARLRSALGQLALGLCALHELGKVHRDVKPANVLVTAEGRAVLVDFGLASDLALEPTLLEARGAGTRAFMAPEQAASQSVSSAADWYSFGVVLYLLLSGELPFRGADLQRQKLRGSPKLVTELSPEAPAELCQLVLELLAPEPAQRPDGRRVLECFGLGAPPAAVERGVPFIGRSQELARLFDAFSSAGQKPASALVIGDSGLGKSALMREFCAQLSASEPDALVLAGRCYERELLPYKALDGIIDGLSQFLGKLEPAAIAQLLPENAGILTQVFPVLERVPGLERSFVGPSEPLERRASAFAALREIFVRLAKQRRLLLYIDDLQWADADSHLLLTDLLRPPEAPAFCLIATARPRSGDGVDPIRALGEQSGEMRRIELLPLPFADAQRLASAVLGKDADSSVAPTIAKETQGHPLFVLALAAHARQKGGLDSRAPRLEDALVAHVDNVEPAARRLLELTAVAGAPLPSDVAAQASALDAAAYSANVASLRLARLVRTSSGDALGQIEPYHDRIRETLLERMNADQRRQLHEALANALASTGRAEIDPQGLVRHLEGAGQLAEAAKQAEVAATHAEHALAFDQAAELYATALRIGKFDAERRHALTLALAEAFTNAGRGAQSAEAYLTAAASADAERALEYRRLAADHMLRSGHLERGTAILSDVLLQMGDRLRSQRRSLATTLFERLRLRVRGLDWQPRAESEIPPAMLRRIDAYHAVGISLALIDPTRGAAFETRALRLALNAGEPRRVAATSVMEACYEASIGARGMRSARRLLEQVDRVRALSGDPYVAAIRGIVDGFMSYHAGEFGKAVEVLGATEQALSKLPGTYFEQAFCHCFRLICLRYCGELAELGQGYFEWVRRAERRGDRFTATSLRFNLNGIWLARDEPEEALRDLTRVMWMPPEGGYHMQHWYEQQARAEIALYRGDAQAGLAHFRHALAAMSRSFILRMRIHRSYAGWLLGRLLLATAGPGAALAEADAIAQQLWSEDVGFARTWSLLVSAAVAHRRAQPDEAVSALRQAMRAAERAGLSQLEQAAGHQLGLLLGGDAGAALTSRALAWAAEQRIRNPKRLFAAWLPGFV